ncbi:hypothetical protein RHGRI_038046 [Rhododendron griersonianum]|uniref:Uncharacterized protein n=1 Tax=Rhododendron griersonianum TaxID=479676 RepID=A0AAV6HUQ0_9ERIC|nr:hypothetical protein RHGRI_038046 [Rhododendron griersonianum]
MKEREREREEKEEGDRGEKSRRLIAESSSPQARTRAPSPSPFASEDACRTLSNDEPQVRQAGLPLPHQPRHLHSHGASAAGASLQGGGGELEQQLGGDLEQVLEQHQRCPCPLRGGLLFDRSMAAKIGLILGISEIGDFVVCDSFDCWRPSVGGGFGGGDWCLAVVWDCSGDNGGGGEVSGGGL